MHFNGSHVNITNRNGTTLAEGTKVGRLYRLDLQAETDRALAISEPLSWDDLHRVYAHLNTEYLRVLVRHQMVTGLAVDTTSVPSTQCDTCIKGKHHKSPVPKESHTTIEEIGDLTLSDYWGPCRIKGIWGVYYFITFTDGKS